VADKPYNEAAYRTLKRILRTANLECWRPNCTNLATSPDHDPPLSAHTHVAGSGCCVLRPACKPCQDRQGAAIRNAKSSSGYAWP
jgi:hypothetical protein